MTNRVLVLGFGLLFLLVQFGCNDIVTPPPGGGAGIGGGGELCSDEGGPVVAIVQPVPASDPDGAGLITTTDVNIQCQVDSSGDPVDDSSVIINVFGDEDAAVTPVVANEGDGSFGATANVSDFPNGSLRVTCEASNDGPRGACSSAAVDTLLDLGPGIEILNPSMSGAVVSGGMTVRYTLTRLPVTESDTTGSGLGGAAEDNQVVVAGQVITPELESAEGDSATYRAQVVFDDPSLYPTPLDGTYQLSVSATNNRGVTRTAALDFTVDADGPGITINEPELGSVIGGATDVVATVSDVSGIDPSRVSFTIGSDEFEMLPVPGTSGRFRGSFDANQYDTSIGELPIDVVAFDIAGNKRVASVVVELDGKPPVAELDPAPVREGKIVSNDLECSALFNPLGDNAISDGNVVRTRAYIRARIEDRGNPSASYKAGMNYDTAQVWILGDTSKGLVLDTDDDANNHCDSLNPAVLPGNPEGNTPAVAINLIALSPSGNADFLAGQSFGGAPAYSGCVSGSKTEPGEPVCLTTTTPRIIPDNDEPSGSTPAIFVKGPTIPFYCMGDPFDWQAALDVIEGPACMALHAEDERGNSSVSEPIKVCFASGLPGEPLSPGNPCQGFGIGSSAYNAYTCKVDSCNGAKFPVDERIGPFN